MHYLCLIFILLSITSIYAQDKTIIRWCAKSMPELKKCYKLQQALNGTAGAILNATYSFSCYSGAGTFDCMKAIKEGNADVMNLDMGLAYQGAQLYELRPFMSENYNSSNLDNERNLYYYSNIVKPKGVTIDINNLRNQKACFSGVGTAEGWIFPLGEMKKRFLFDVSQCNSLVQSVGDFFSATCSPGAYETAFNPFGDNAENTCKLCRNKGFSTEYCTYHDQYSGNEGALYCLDYNRKQMLALNGSADQGPSMAFVRSQEIDLLRDRYNFPADEYELLCPDKQADGTYNAPLTQWQACAWGGAIQGQVLVALLTVPEDTIISYQTFFGQLVTLFGNSTAAGAGYFTLFSTNGYGLSNHGNTTSNTTTTTTTTTTTAAPIPAQATTTSYINPPGVPRRHNMFSEHTMNLYPLTPTQFETFFTYQDAQFSATLTNFEKCTLPQMRWCVVNNDEMTKCEKMKNALDAKRIKPQFNCVLGQSKIGCMTLIREGFADMFTVDAAELYTAGKVFNLVPFATEFYGDSYNYYAVAIAKKTDRQLLVSNLKYRRVCHGGVGKATGWVVPINLALDTQQIRVYDGHLIYAYSELVARACIPGILNEVYDPHHKNPVNLCDTCAAGGDDRCQPDSRELYYGDGGAFRCLVENGDIAFARHTTINEYTGSRHKVFWARNRRRDDFQLLCSDGSRAESYEWRRCNLGEVPGSTVVTSAAKSNADRQNLWQLLRYAQEYYSSDENPVFQMFHSGFERHDLLFTDSALRLEWIDAKKQNYTEWLGRSFIRKVENLFWMGNPGETGMYNTANSNNNNNIISVLLCLSLLFFPRFLC